MTHLDFLCCHLTADQQGESKLDKRNQNAMQEEYPRVSDSELVQSLVQDEEPTGYIFIVGDLNYRITMLPDQCINTIGEGIGHHNKEAIYSLFDNDQLITCLATAASFPGFQELTLPSFAPTYKKRVIFEMNAQKQKQLTTLPDYTVPASVYDGSRTPSQMK